MKIPLPERDSECNSVEVDENGSVFFSYRRGARLVSRHGLVVWDFVRDNDSQEVQTATIIDGGYMVALCGHPSMIYEIDNRGNKVKKISFETGIESVHGQFRQVKKAKNGNYLVPLMNGKELLELDSLGGVVAKLPVGGFSVVELEDGNLMLPGKGKIVVVDRKSGDLIREIDAPKSSFLTEVNVLPNGNLLLTNWQGYRKKDTPSEWLAIEMDRDGKVVWTFDDESKIKRVSAICQYEGLVEEL